MVLLSIYNLLIQQLKNQKMGDSHQLNQVRLYQDMTNIIQPQFFAQFTQQSQIINKNYDWASKLSNQSSYNQLFWYSQFQKPNLQFINTSNIINQNDININKNSNYHKIYYSSFNPQLSPQSFINLSTHQPQNNTFFKFKNNKKIHIKQNINSRQLTRIWAVQIILTLSKIIHEQINHKQQLLQIKKKLSKLNLTLKQFAKIINHNSYLRSIIKFNILDKSNLKFSYVQYNTLSQKSKYILQQSFQTLKIVIQNQNTFISWNLNKRQKQLYSLQLYQNCINKTNSQISSIIYDLIQQQELARKCSIYNNITYFWGNYLKYLLGKIEMNKQNRQQYKKLKSILKSVVAIQQIVKAINIGWFNQRIKKQVKNNNVIKWILINQEINLYTKKCLIDSYDIFIQGINQPSNLKGWKKKKQ